MNCPACKSRTVEEGFEGSRGARVLLDVCPTCHGLWFDSRESIHLSANGVLRLFQQIHGQSGQQHHRLEEPLSCPRCRAKLARSHDLSRGNRYQYFRCPQEHGHFITFFQFLREKAIVRSLNPKELVELKKHVQLLQCSDCGGAISLEGESACPHCRAPVCILDPKALGSTVEDLRPVAAAAGAVVAPAVAAQLLMDQMGMDSFFRKVDAQARATSAVTLPTSDGGQAAEGMDVAEAVETGIDLIELGIELFFDIAGGIGDLF
ncbi:zf-TFIIB domain-containing protein [Hyalangium gracile]|uniref:zf-TFIIB domain-containing protein n=1 Tax=Hyalangium gracile TaxID=394092 RepID=UPI001CCC2009|nr:zf-TFIIB domain-containing protein [Hyalangium gracile]